MNGDTSLVLQMNKAMHTDLLDQVSYSNITPWEVEFLDDIGRALHDNIILSKNQQVTLNQVYNKYCQKSEYEIEAEVRALIEDQR